MRTTLNLDEALIERARKLTGIKEKTARVHAGIEPLIARASAQRLAALGGTEKVTSGAATPPCLGCWVKARLCVIPSSSASWRVAT